MDGTALFVLGCYPDEPLFSCIRAGLMLGGSRTEFMIKCNRDELKIECSRVEFMPGGNRAEFMLGCS